MTLWPAADLGVTLAAYVAARELRRRYASPFTVPIVGATLLVIVYLVAAHRSYAAYAAATASLAWLLGPAVVALGVGLVRGAAALRGRRFVAILAGAVTGVAVTTSLALSGAALLGLPVPVRDALALKAATTGVAVQAAAVCGIDPLVATVGVLASGILGAAFGGVLLRRCGFREPLTIGVATGSVAHGIGTAQLAQDVPDAAPFAGLAMTFGGIAVATLAPAVLHLMRR